MRRAPQPRTPRSRSLPPRRRSRPPPRSRLQSPQPRPTNLPTSAGGRARRRGAERRPTSPRPRPRSPPPPTSLRRAEEPAPRPSSPAEEHRPRSPLPSAAEAPAPRHPPPRLRRRSRGPRSGRRSAAARAAPQALQADAREAGERKPITRVPKPEPELGRRQERRGVVVSDKGDKTIVVKVSVTKAHPKYKKVVRRTAQVPRPRRGQHRSDRRHRAHHRDAAAVEDQELASRRDRGKGPQQ